MSDPKRLSSGDDLGATLLASARGDLPRPASRARAAAALGLVAGAAFGAATVASSGTASAAGASVAPKAIGASASVGTKVLGALWLKLFAAGVVTVAVAGGVAVKMDRSAEHADSTVPERSSSKGEPLPTTRPPVPLVAPPPAAAAAEAPALPMATDPSMPEQDARRPIAVPTTTEVATKATPRPQSSVPAESPLARELRSLDGARAALGRGDARTAITELDRHDRAFPSGSLGTEAKVLRAEALLARGDRASARRLAKELLARDPSSPHAQRLRTIAESSE